MTDYRLLSLLIPASASGLGFFCFAVLAFSFTELAALPEAFRTGLVLVGSFSLAFGAEVGTLANVVEIYRKGERLGRWDKVALAVSVLATFGAFVLAFASLLGVKATWGAAVQLWGPIFLGVLAALDSYGGFMELGLYLHRKPIEAQAEQARRREAWRLSIEDEVWKAEQHAEYKRKLATIAGADDTTTAQLAAQLRERDAQLNEADAQVAQLQAQVAASAAQPMATINDVVDILRNAGESPSAIVRNIAELVDTAAMTAQLQAQVAPQVAADTPQVAPAAAQLQKAEVADWRRLTADLNGQRHTLTKAQGRALITAAGFALPSARAYDLWWKAFDTARQEEL